jgi:hypothetical protein
MYDTGGHVFDPEIVDIDYRVGQTSNFRLPLGLDYRLSIVANNGKFSVTSVSVCQTDRQKGRQNGRLKTDRR